MVSLMGAYRWPHWHMPFHTRDSEAYCARSLNPPFGWNDFDGFFTHSVGGAVIPHALSLVPDFLSSLGELWDMPHI